MKYPTENTIREFYNNFNYGLLLNSQLQSMLYIYPSASESKLHVSTTIDILQQHISTHFSSSWNQLLKRNRNNLGFNNQSVTITQSIKLAFQYRSTWLQQNGPGVIVDFHTPLMGENMDCVVFSDSKPNNETDASDGEDIDDTEWNM